MFLLDTNILSECMRPEPAATLISWLDNQPGDRMWISAITRAEIELGIALLPDGRRRQELVEAAKGMFIEEFAGRCLPFDQEAAVSYAAVVAARTQNGRPISVEDAQIAAIALVHNLTIATRNQRDFEDINGLAVINPWSND